MGFNRRKMDDQRREAAEKEAANRRATDAQVLEDAERLISAWNDRQEKRMPMLFSPTIGAAVTAGYWFLWVRCPACRTINAIDLRTLDRHPDAAVTSLIPWLSCRSCRPNAPFAELVRLSRKSIADEMREEHRRRVFGEYKRCQTKPSRAGSRAPWPHLLWNSSTLARNVCGIVRPRAAAVLTLMASSNLVGCSTGISLGFVPRRILSTISAAFRNRSG
jgi:hypothetical protein